MNSTYFRRKLWKPEEARLLAARVLAHLGDAVFSLYERERQLDAVNVNAMHVKTAARTSATAQAKIMQQITPRLTEQELDLVRRAKNAKVPRRGAITQDYRQATAFEALLGFLYLTDPNRLRELLDFGSE